MNKELSLLLIDKLKDLTYLDRTSGIVQVVEKVLEKDGDVQITKRIPVTTLATAELASTQLKTVDMIPNGRYTGMAYFEDNGISAIERESNGMRYTSALRLVVWMNTQKIVGKPDMLLSSRAITDIMNRLVVNPYNQMPFAKVITKAVQILQSKAIFENYDYDNAEAAYLMAPYEFFAIDFNISYSVPAACSMPLKVIGDSTC